MKISAKTFLRQAVPITVAEITMQAIMAEPENSEEARTACMGVIRNCDRIWNTFHPGLGKMVALPDKHAQEWQRCMDRITTLATQTLYGPEEKGFLSFYNAVLGLVELTRNQIPKGDEREKLWGELAEALYVIYTKADPDEDKQCADYGAIIGDEMQRAIDGLPCTMNDYKKTIRV